MQNEPSAGQPRLLIVDDAADNRFLMQALLEDRYAIETAEDGASALLRAAAHPRPDLVLLDIVMPGLDGYEVLRRLRAQAETADIPVIFLTALSSPEEEQAGFDLGASDYISKPISPPLLLARVQAQLERSATQRRLQALTEMLSRYVAPQVYRSLFDGSRQAEIRAQRKKLTVFFSDIQDFTASTAKWQPEDIKFLLNSYFSEMAQIAVEHGGTLDKFIGDGMLVFFGDPDSRGVREDALQCVRMAMAMQRRMHRLREAWRERGCDKGFQVRMGIHTGYCDVGNFGSDLRMDYTIIGPEVNMAARLQQAAPAGGILLSRDTCALVEDEVIATEQQPVFAKGFADPIPAFLVCDPEARQEDGRVIRRAREGLRVLIDLERLSAAERAAAALELRAMADSLH